MYNDTQLKQALAKMLPDVIGTRTYHYVGGSNTYLVWKAPESQQRGITQGRPVLDTELLHLCWLVECQLSTCDWINYRIRLIQDSIIGRDISSAWQQRTIALAKVKGIEI